MSYVRGSPNVVLRAAWMQIGQESARSYQVRNVATHEPMRWLSQGKALPGKRENPDSVLGAAW